MRTILCRVDDARYKVLAEEARRDNRSIRAQAEIYIYRRIDEIEKTEEVVK